MASVMAWDKGYIQKMAASLKPLFSTQEAFHAPRAPAPGEVANQTAEPGK